MRKLPRRRPRRPRGRARPEFRGDFRPGDQDITKIGPADPWDGETVLLSALRGEPRYAPAPAPAPTHSAAGRGWTMTVNTGGPGVPMDTRLRRARAFLDLKLAYLESEGMGYRIDDAEQVRERGEKLDGRSIIARTGREGSAHLLAPSGWLTRNSARPWQPAGGWAEEWVDELPWYDPGARESESWWDGQPASGGTA